MAAQCCTTRNVKWWGWMSFLAKLGEKGSSNQMMHKNRIFRLHFVADTEHVVKHSWLQKFPLWVKWRKITSIMRFKVIQGHHYRYQWKARVRQTNVLWANPSLTTVRSKRPGKVALEAALPLWHSSITYFQFRIINLTFSLNVFSRHVQTKLQFLANHSQCWVYYYYYYMIYIAPISRIESEAFGTKLLWTPSSVTSWSKIAQDVALGCDPVFHGFWQRTYLYNIRARSNLFNVFILPGLHRNLHLGYNFYSRVHGSLISPFSSLLTTSVFHFKLKKLRLGFVPFHHRPFPHLPDWFHGVLDHSFCSACLNGVLD